MATLRKAAGLICALILMTCGMFLAGGIPLVGIPLMLVGLGAAIWQAKELYASRQDPYDLNKLWDRPAEDEEPDYELLTDEEGTPYCHHCGHAVPRPYAHCPECGNPVR